MSVTADFHHTGTSVAQRLGNLVSSMFMAFPKYYAFRNTMEKLSKLDDAALAARGIDREMIPALALEAANRA